MNLDAHLLLVVGVCILYVVGMDLAVLELDASCNLSEVVSGDVLVEVDVVDLLLEELRMGELRSQVAIVGEQEHTRGVTVETSDGVDALGAGILDEVHDRLALLRVVGSSDIVLGLVEQNVDLLLKRDGLVVESYLVSAEYLGAQFGDDIAIDGDDTSLDELVGLAA